MGKKITLQVIGTELNGKKHQRLLEKCVHAQLKLADALGVDDVGLDASHSTIKGFVFKRSRFNRAKRALWNWFYDGYVQKGEKGHTYINNKMI